MTTQPTEPAPPALRTVGEIVDERVTDLQNRFLRERRDPAAVAALARLRRGVGKAPGDVLDILEFTVSAEFRPGPDETEPSADEWAAHVAMALFAVHQQSRGERMHRRGRGLGTALRSLHSGDQKSLPEPLARRFRTLGTADSFPELIHHLRGAVQLLRIGGAPLDYGLLADQLVTWQRYGPDQVQLTWGRQFYRTRRTALPDDQPPA
jgi:CRISPR system Cascade subunit CasB